jgi:methyl-accepting chemotaxis protein
MEQTTGPTWRAGAARIVALMLVAQVPVFALAARFFDSGVGLSLALSALVLAGPLMAYWRAPESRFCAVMLGIGSVCMSAVLIHLGHGMIEMHFHIFVTLGVLILLGDAYAIVAAAATVAVHHVLFWLVLPASVFNYNAGFGIVLLHALFVVVETVPCCYVAIRLGHACDAEAVTVARLPAAMREVSSASSHISDLSSRLSANTGEHRAAAEETTAAIREIGVVAKRNVENSTQSAALIEEMFGKYISVAGRNADDMSKTMDEIRQSSHKINEILTVIDSIAFQTNILSLNAAIEAARAGESGAGFSVVAEEVRNLAGRCAEAARDTRALVEQAVQSSTSGSAQTLKLTTAMHAVSSQEDRFRKAFEVIQGGSREQFQAIGQVEHSLKQVDAALEDLTQIATVAVDASGELETQTRTLEGLVEALR